MQAALHFFDLCRLTTTSQTFQQLLLATSGCVPVPRRFLFSPECNITFPFPAPSKTHFCLLLSGISTSQLSCLRHNVVHDACDHGRPACLHTASLHLGICYFVSGDFLVISTAHHDHGPETSGGWAPCDDSPDRLCLVPKVQVVYQVARLLCRI